MSVGTEQLRAAVAARAALRCEYCRSPQVVTAQTFHVDHIVLRSKGGITSLENLAYACPRCNLRKKDVMTVIAPATDIAICLFHPRKHTWDEHFAWSEDFIEIVGRTSIDRATAAQLQLNDEVLRRARAMWVQLKLKLIP